MTLLNAINHLTFVTADMDRLIDFYESVFDAETVLDMTEGDDHVQIRHTFIRVGPHTYLHPFEIPGVQPPAERGQMFDRGRLDHFALNAASEEAFYELRRRVMAQGRDSGEIIDMGNLLLFNFTDPDQGEHEVVWMKPDVPVDAALPRSEWKRVPV